MPHSLRYLSESLGLGNSFTRVIFINSMYFDNIGEESVFKLIRSRKWNQPLLIISLDFFVDIFMLRNVWILLFSFLFWFCFVAFHLVIHSQYVWFLESDIGYQLFFWVVWIKGTIKFYLLCSSCAFMYREFPHNFSILTWRTGNLSLFVQMVFVHFKLSN